MTPEKSPRIYLARHGQNTDNAAHILNGHRDQPLTELGIQQAHRLAENIKTEELHFDTIYSSPLQRALVTAQIIAETIGSVAPVILDQLIERDFGEMTGQLESDIEKLCAPHILKTHTVTYFLEPKGGETFSQALVRAQQVLAFCTEHHSQGDILLVSHGDFGKMLYAAYYKLDWREVLAQFHFDNSELLLLSADSRPDETHVFRTN